MEMMIKFEDLEKKPGLTAETQRALTDPLIFSPRLGVSAVDIDFYG